MHNDLLNSVRECGMNSFLYSTVVMLNLFFLPYSDGRFGNMIQACFDDLKATVKSDCPLFQHFAADIAWEKGLAPRGALSAYDEREVWSDFLDSVRFRRRGRKVGLCRWGQMYHELGGALRDWTSLFVVLVRLGIRERFMSNSHFAALIRPVEQAHAAGALPGTEGDDTRTADSSAAGIKALRAACKNALQFVTMVMGDERNHRRALVVSLASQKFVSWYSASTDELKNGLAGGLWTLELLNGGIWTPFRETWTELMTPSYLELLGLRIYFDAGDFQPAPYDARLVDDSFTAQLCGKLVQALLRRRACRTAFLVWGWPGRFCRLADTEPGVVESTAHELKRDLRLFRKAETQGTRFYDDIVARSPFQKPSVMQIAHPMDLTDFVVGDLIRGKCARLNLCFKQSRIVENGFKSLREEESTRQNNEVVADAVLEGPYRQSRYRYTLCFQHGRHDCFSSRKRCQCCEGYIPRQCGGDHH